MSHIYTKFELIISAVFSLKDYTLFLFFFYLCIRKLTYTRLGSLCVQGTQINKRLVVNSGPTQFGLILSLSHFCHHHKKLYFQGKVQAPDLLAAFFAVLGDLSYITPHTHESL